MEPFPIVPAINELRQGVPRRRAGAEAHAAKQDLVVPLRTHRMMRQSQLASTVGRPRGQIRDAISIRDRPADVEDRAIPGLWSGAWITVSHNSHIATLVERRSRFTLLVKVRGHDTLSVVSALQREIGKRPAVCRFSVNVTRGWSYNAQAGAVGTPRSGVIAG